MNLLGAAIGSLVLVGTVAVAATAALKPGMWSTVASASTDNAYARGDITSISPKVAGYVVEVAVGDNARVRAGQVLFRIDDADYRARVDQALAIRAGRMAALGNLDARMQMQRAVIEQAGAAVVAARADALHAHREAARARELAGRQLISLSMLDAADASDGRTAATVSGSLANVAASRQQLAVLASQRPQIQADIASAQAAVELARIDLRNTLVRAPADGWMGEIQARTGQYVKAGTEMAALVSGRVWVIANFKETQMAGVAVGSAAQVSVDAIPDRIFSGRVESLSPASGSQFALLPPDNATGNFTRIAQRIPVRVVLDIGQPGVPLIRPGMSSVVRVGAQPRPVASPASARAGL
jgi:membrane fusion protein (multidrug efflux system)